MDFSRNVSKLTPSATLALAARARKLKEQGIPVVDLSAGEPAWSTPEYAARGGIEAIDAGKTGYPPTRGVPELREAVAAYLEQTTALTSVDPGAIMVSAGVKQALFNCCYTLFGAGDEILVPAPYWPSYPTIIELAGATPVVVDSTWDDHFLLDVDQLEAARTPRTRCLMVNSPCNPTGAVYGPERLAEITAWCAEHGIWILSDEIYRRISFGDAAPSILDVADGYDRVVAMDGMSKTFCMPGWRIGYAYGPVELIDKATDLQGQTTSGAVGPSQYAAAAALADVDAREAWLSRLMSLLEASRSLGMELFGQVEGLEVRPPPGGIYFYARLPQGESSMEVADRMLADAAVACVPGEPLGSPGHLRFNFAVEEERIREGLTRLAEFFASN